jgi:structural maintenance of chromosome 1
LEKELLSVKDSVQDAKAERASRESSAKLTETVATLQAHFPGVRGVLSELMAVRNPKYAGAIAVAFGRHMDSIAVDEQATALTCIHYLREQRLPPLTFVPLDTIKVRITTIRNTPASGSSFVELTTRNSADSSLFFVHLS